MTPRCLLQVFPIGHHHFTYALQGVFLYFSVVMRHHLHNNIFPAQSADNHATVRIESHELSDIIQRNTHLRLQHHIKKVTINTQPQHSTYQITIVEQRYQGLHQGEVVVLHELGILLPKLLRVQHSPSTTTINHQPHHHY